MPRGRGPDPRRDLFELDIFEQVARGPRAHRLQDELVVREHREDEHGGGRDAPARRLVTSVPDMPGSLTSISTTSGAKLGTRRSAASPLPASSTLKPSSSSSSHRP